MLRSSFAPGTVKRIYERDEGLCVYCGAAAPTRHIAITEAEAEEMRQRRRDGQSIRAIAAEMGRAPSAVQKHLAGTPSTYGSRRKRPDRENLNCNQTLCDCGRPKRRYAKRCLMCYRAAQSPRRAQELKARAPKPSATRTLKARALAVKGEPSATRRAVMPAVPHLAPNACIHHWLVASVAVGGQFAARCKLCGEKRTFPVELLYTKRAEGGLAAWPRASGEML